MVNLEDKIGLNVQLKDNFRLEFGTDVEFDQFSTRNFSDLKIVAAEEDLSLSDQPAYLMYRNLRKSGDLKKIKTAHLRFDITVIPPGKLGEEFIKTSGHYHPKKAGTEIAYPELYYVILGQATYLNQKVGSSDKIEDVVLSRVKAGEAIITPPNYGHVTINELDQPIVMANWVCDDFKSVYGDYEKKRGAIYYLKNQTLTTKIEKNPRYLEDIKLKELKSAPKILDELSSLAIYNYINKIDKLKFLSDPDQFVNDLTIKNLFQIVTTHI